MVGVKVTKQSFAETVAKGVPVVGGFVSGGLTYVTFRPGAVSLIFKSDKNMGMAVALNRLAQAAIHAGYGYILLLDQNSVAAKGMVACLKMHVGKSVGIVSPMIIDRNVCVDRAEQDASYMGVREVTKVCTSGSLLNLDAYTLIGGFDELLFVDWVDFDYCNALRVNGYKLLAADGTYLLHENGRKEYVGKRVGRNPHGRIVLKDRWRTNHPVWRMRDRGRSMAICDSKWRNTCVDGDAAEMFRGTVLGTLLWERQGVRKALALVIGWIDGKRAYRSTRRWASDERHTVPTSE